MKKTLRDYQTEAIEATLAREYCALIVLASGLGKTVTAAVFARKWWDKNRKSILFLVDKNEPIDDQAMPTFEDYFADTGLTIRKFTGRSKRTFSADIVFATFQTMRKNLHRFARQRFGLVIVDECHHGQAATYNDVIKHFRAKFRLGLTATPNRADGQDIREIFGEEVYDYSLAKAIADGRWLAEVDYRVLFDNVDIRKLQTLMRRAYGGDRTVTHKMIDKIIFLPERIEEIVRRILAEQRKGAKKTIVFCNSKEHLGLVRRHFKTRAEPYHSGIPKGVLKKRLADFRTGKVRILLTIDKMNEAIDIPDAELVVFLRSIESETVWKQQLGRGLRRTNGKRSIVVLDFVMNCKRFFLVSQLKKQVAMVGKSRKLLLKTGWRFEFVERTVDMVELLDFLEHKLYATWGEAAEATRTLGIASKKDYKTRYKEDPNLPSTPHQMFRSVWSTNGGWPGFLGRSRLPPGRRVGGYPCYSYTEAARAIRKLGINTRAEYNRRYKEDPRLPSSPHHFFSGKWRKKGGWSGFFGREPMSGILRHYRLFPSWAAAARAVRKLGINTRAEYNRRYKKDPRLPSSPNTLYADKWTAKGGWPGFLGKRR